MDHELWGRLEEICFEALNRPADARPAFIAEACAGRPELRREVEAHVAAFEQDPAFLEIPIARVGSLDMGGPVPEGAHAARMGPYRLIRLLGRGGMGEVFLAADETQGLQRFVALKIIRRGLDDDDVLRRFRLERQILASLHHPNIAQLITGGATHDGRPYFVMEYVEGLPIDQYCDRRRLTIGERLDLFLKVCDAVQHAHQAMVVHRDLKPGNVLVTQEGEPKLLDFGIGKILSLGTVSGQGIGAYTPTQTMAFTPEYASPEQMRGEPVSAASDVYALGVLLCVLLTGRHPFSETTLTLEELEHAVRETPAPKPSAIAVRNPAAARGGDAATLADAMTRAARRSTDPTRLARRIAGDLDHIVLKALRKERGWRYPLVSAFADDIRRHLDGRPVAARGDALTYRAGKFVRRHSWAVATASVILAALTTTTSVTLRSSRRVTEERDRALEVKSFLLESFGAAAPDRTGAPVAARQLLDAQVAQLDVAYADRPVLLAEMMEVVGEAYDRLGLYAEAEPLVRRALDLRRRAQGETHPHAAVTLGLLGWISYERGKSAEADSLLRRAVEILRLAGPDYQLALSRAQNDLGVVLDRSGARDEAVGLYREALATRTRLLGSGHRAVGITANNLAAALYRKQEYEDAVRVQEQALRALRASVGPDHQRSIIAQSNLAAMKMAAGQLASAEQEYRDLLERQRRLQGAAHPVTAHMLNSLAMVLNRNERFDEAERFGREALGIREAALGKTHPDVATTLIALGDAAAGQERRTEALAFYDRALAIRRATPRDTAAIRAVVSRIEKVLTGGPR